MDPTPIETKEKTKLEHKQNKTTKKPKSFLSKELIHAVTHYNSKKHQELLTSWVQDKTLDKNMTDHEGRTLLHHAALAGQDALIIYLLKLNLRCNAEDNLKYTPLLLAIDKAISMDNNQRKKVMKCIQILLLNGARLISSNSFFPHIATNIAAQNNDKEMLQFLKKNGVSIFEIYSLKRKNSKNTIEYQSHGDITFWASIGKELAQQRVVEKKGKINAKQANVVISYLLEEVQDQIKKEKSSSNSQEEQNKTGCIIS